MSDIDSFKTIYSYVGVEGKDSTVIHETQVDASIKHLTVRIAGARLFTMDETFSSKAGANFRKSSYCTNNADGVVLGELGGRKLLIVCELKSSYGNLQGGLNQLKSAYVKICQNLSICEDFDISNYEVYFILTVFDDASFLSQMNTISMLPDPQRKPVESLIYDMYQNRQVDRRLNSTALPFAPHFHHIFVSRNVKLVLGKSTTNSVTVSL